MASIMTSMPLLGDNRPKVRMTGLPAKPSRALAASGVTNATSGMPWGMTSILSSGPLHRGRLGQHGMERGHHRHGEAGQQDENVGTGCAAKNSEFVLQADRVEAAGIQEIGGARIGVDIVGFDLQSDRRG